MKQILQQKSKIEQCPKLRLGIPCEKCEKNNQKSEEENINEFIDKWGNKNEIEKK